jgi:arsenical pump membrane protein
MHEGLAYATTLMIVALVIALPGTRLGLRLGPASIAGLGVALLVLAGVVSPADIIDGIAILWRPFLTVLSIMLTTALAQRLGVLEYFAALIHFDPMRTRHNFFCVFTLSALTSAVLNNDAAIMLVTPLIVSMVRRCYPKRPNLIVAFAFAVFSAAGVAPLVISNPMNLIVAEYAGIGFNEYAVRMLPVSVLGWTITYAVLHVLFSRQLAFMNPDITQEIIDTTQEKIDPVLSRPAKQFLIVMAVALGAYPLLSYAGGPVWGVAASAAAIGVALAWHHRLASPNELRLAVPWDILVFLFCVFVIVIGLRNVGFVGRIADVYATATEPAAKIMLIGISSAVGSAVLNNHPMAIINALAITSLPDPTPYPVLAALIGGDLGPRLLPMGSLAGLLWLGLLRKDGIYISHSQFIFVGILVTLPTLSFSLLLLVAMAAR